MSNITIKALTIVPAVATLILAAPIVPASAQGVPAGLMRLDPPQASETSRLTETEQAKLRSAYAHVRKHAPAH